MFMLVYWVNSKLQFLMSLSVILDFIGQSQKGKKGKIKV